MDEVSLVIAIITFVVSVIRTIFGAILGTTWYPFGYWQ